MAETWIDLFGITGFLCAFLTIYLFYWLMKRYQTLQIFRHYGIPGPEPSLLCGNFIELRSAETPNEIITSWLQKYGKMFGFYIGDQPHLVINDINIIKQVFITKSQIFVNRPKMFLKIWPLIRTLIYLRDEEWKTIRSTLIPTFNSSKIKAMTTIMNYKVDKLLDMLQQFSAKDQSFDMYVRTQGLSLDVIGECALALKVNCQQDTEDSLLIAVRDFFKYSNNTAVTIAIFFPPLRVLLEFISNWFSSGKMTSMIVNNVKNVIAYRRQHKTEKAIDVLQLMLDTSVDSPENLLKNKKLLSDEDIIANAYIFILAGYETTATALAFTFYLLVKHQDIQEKLYRILCDRLKDNHYPSYEEINNIEYLDQVFSESMRYYPPVTGFISRECREKCTINDITIPKGVIVFAPIWDIHHDPNLWPDPWTFDPDRFSAENKHCINSTSFLPFGLGQRQCIGMRFAQIEAKLTIARVILNYRLISCEEMDDPLPLICPTVIINPKNGIYVKALKRTND